MSKEPEVEKPEPIYSLRSLGSAERRYVLEMTNKMGNFCFSKIVDVLDCLTEKSVLHSGGLGKPGKIFELQSSYLSPLSVSEYLVQHYTFDE